ncbi:ATPase, P-type, HAD superfamily, subfamily IC, putative [Synechococcus sp. PCC 7335]|uniref:cation-translocating P-type ATPase n=1 Tax=Synechococcus sp. (strain ATCC 29403 / PCC 7335) TaxID=91464 RepID=UPI00017EB120|nr:cation-translocating P-type ATPase [Synechococcus sp. PCC 7335]EDX87245.1 ATPase, P-type, HAD superfamily, subfamily IC, putative [Synechococcus sp. PCC 7335]
MTTVQQWHTLSIDDVTAALDTDTSNGLSAEEAKNRLNEYGPNELVETGRRSRLRILLDQFSDIMLLMLIAVAVVAAVLDLRAGNFPKDAIAIGAIVLLNAVLGYFQESKAEDALAALKGLSSPNVTVVRSSQTREVSAKQLVPGDLVLIEAGNQIAADGRLLESVTLHARESALTGEAKAVEKQANMVLAADTNLAEQKNLVFQGTEIVHGRGKMLVTRTGMKTELGKIATMIQSVSELRTPLQQRLDQLGRTLVVGSLSLVALVVIGGSLAMGWSAFEELLTVSLSMAVAVVPEGLPAVITVTLALGTQRMVKRQALIRRLPAVETLGSVTTICSDKTGTLTQNKMVVQHIHVSGLPFEQDFEVSGQGYVPEGEFRLSGKKIEPLEKPALALLLLDCALCNDAALQTEVDDQGSHKWVIVGDPTEGALVTLAAKAGLEKKTLEYEFERLAEFPFSSERKRMSVVVSVPKSNRLGINAPYAVFAKGSAELLLACCSQVGKGARSLTEADRKQILEKVDSFASAGGRVLGFAYRPIMEKVLAEGSNSAQQLTEADVEKDLIWLGSVSMIDALRPEVREAVKRCQQAGIRPIMITGDHPLTAKALAADLGLVNEHRASALAGQEIEKMSTTELESVVSSTSVYARVSPEHKLRIVQALQAQKQVVAMTGDGVNDAPALKQADIGIAMGITGTDVSKEASDMVLLDDNFASIVAATEEGRVVYGNIRKFVKYILGSNIGEVITIALSPLLLPIVAVPLTPLQILWMNLVTDGFPALALALEPSEPNIMDRPPHDPEESIFARGLGAYMVRVGIIFAILAISLMLWAYGYTHSETGLAIGSPERWKTMVFTMLCLSQMGHAIAVRSSKRLALEMSQFSNPYVLLAVVVTTLLQLLLIYAAPLRNFFGTHYLSITELLVCVGFSSLLFVWLELEKLFIRSRTKHATHPDLSLRP